MLVNIGAERTLAAERDGERSAVETKSFIELSLIQDLKEALGQFILYRVHHCLVHVDIINDKIWIQRDGTDNIRIPSPVPGYHRLYAGTTAGEIGRRMARSPPDSGDRLAMGGNARF
jgi:hypothetical protein